MRDFCGQHAKAGMVDINTKRCAEEGCSKQPSFGLEGTRKREFCKQHAMDGMVDVKNRKCVHEGCSKLPLFGLEGTRRRDFCGQHAKDGMVDFKGKNIVRSSRYSEKPSNRLEMKSELISQVSERQSSSSRVLSKGRKRNFKSAVGNGGGAGVGEIGTAKRGRAPGAIRMSELLILSTPGVGISALQDGVGVKSEIMVSRP